MFFSNNILKEKLKNVYFIWGNGKTTIANFLKEKYGCYIYSTDDSRYPHMKLAIPEAQPYMCKNFEAEYGVKNFWLLPPEVIAEREVNFVREMTPMIVADLIELSSKHKIIICEGDLDYDAVAPIATHTVHLCNNGDSYDFFDRPDHESLDEIFSKSNLNEDEKARLVANANQVLSNNDKLVPNWVKKNGIKNVMWNKTVPIEVTGEKVAKHFLLSK